MGRPENDLSKAVAKFLKSRVEISTLYQYKSGNVWKNANTRKSWSTIARYRMVTKWRRRNVNFKHMDLWFTFLQGRKLVFYKDSRYVRRQQDFTLSINDHGDRRWYPLITLHFKVKRRYGNGDKVWSGAIGSIPQAPGKIGFTAKKKNGKVDK